MSRLIVNSFHILYYYSPNTWMKNTFLGYEIQQCPMDLHLYQELVCQVRPNYILQTGVNQGGSILYFASLMDSAGFSRDSLVIGIDICLTDRARSIQHPRVRLIEGSSTDPEVVAQIRSLVLNRKGLIVLDSDHTEEHVSKELAIYKDFTEVGSYLIVEDTNVNGHPVRPAFGPGPMEAVEDFLRVSDGFERDDILWQRNLLSFHQFGWLKRIK